jgi:hypothetical protein
LVFVRFLEERRLAVPVRDDDVLVAVAVEVADGEAAADVQRREVVARRAPSDVNRPWPSFARKSGGWRKLCAGS